jgi:hypothetical protein
MDKILLSTKKRFLLPIVCALGLLVWLFLCHEQYRSYWEGTIHRVQTTDFNLLHHTLPPTLSQLIVANRDDLVQKVLDSNYGLFGLVVTDPSDESVLYYTGKIYHRKSWQGHITPDDLAGIKKDEPYDLLTDPPPLAPAWEHGSPRDDKAEHVDVTQTRPASKVLGHLYYVRPEPPPFLEDLSGFLFTGLFEMSGAKRGYLYITLTTMAFSAVVLLMIWLRQRGLEMKQGELDYMQRELGIRKKALEHLAAELNTQKARKLWLEKEADVSYERALTLKQSLERLKEALSLVGATGLSQVQPQSSLKDAEGLFKTRAVHPPSALLEEIEELIPALTDNATTLKSQASLLNDYCSILEQRQAEMKRIVDNAYFRANRVGQPIIDERMGMSLKASENVIDMTP